ncbi:MAG: murein biosynthesis integral membrane protein MurJ, partial [Actinomycetota bacterium]|nr:murein biosynthesis integral membrane protein MurJ [Actinomycetota bacterium]
MGPEDYAPPPEAPPQGPRRGVAVNTAIFSILTGASRVAGLGREILASSYFATSGAFSAFTIAFQVPNLLRMLVADQAISAAFVPVFTELLEQRRRREAFQLASTLFFVILAALGALTALFVLTAGLIMPLLTGDQFSSALDHLTVGLSRILFPTVVLLGLNGLTLGILYAYDDFTIGGIAPLVWNLVIFAVLIPLRHAFHGPDQLYAYAVAVLAGTVAQFLITLPRLRRLGFGLTLTVNLRDPRVTRVLRLMLPISFATGVINISLLINTAVGSKVSDQAPRAIDAAFRIYQLPQGVFAIALATVLFPTLTRFAARDDVERLRASAANGVRQLALLLIPAAAVTLVLAEPITRLIYQHGNFGPKSTDLVSTALFWFSFSLPLNGVNLLLTRTFFSFQRAWLATVMSVLNVTVNLVVSLALVDLGIEGVVIGTLVGNVVMAAGQLFYLRRELHGFEGRRTLLAVGQMTAAAALLAGAAYGTWRGLDAALG